MQPDLFWLKFTGPYFQLKIMSSKIYNKNVFFFHSQSSYAPLALPPIE